MALKLFTKKTKNLAILNKYSIEFNVRKGEKRHQFLSVDQKVITNINFYISSFISGSHFQWLETEVLPEINRALAGETFDDDEWNNADIFLKIGKITSVFDTSNSASEKAAIPTQDLKEIIEAWIEWIVKNKLQ